MTLTIYIVNLGKWILRYIFSRLVDEQIKKDEAFRAELNETVKARQESIPPNSINIPPNASMTTWDKQGNVTPRANGNQYPMTPGMGIGIATPAPGSHLPSVSEDGGSLDKRRSQASRSSAEKPDYFGNSAIASEPPKQPVITSNENQEASKTLAVDTEKENNGKDSSTSFGKKLRMGMSFGTKKLGRSASTTLEKPIVVDESKDKATDEGSESSEAGDKPLAEKEVEDNFNGVIQKIRYEYERLVVESPAQEVESGITPSLVDETPFLRIPGGTTVIIQEETSGGVKDLYRGSVETAGEDADVIGERAPMWLGDLLLKVWFLATFFCSPINIPKN